MKKVLSEKHQPVLVDEVLSFLPKGEILVVDATFGEGGHSQKILEKMEDQSMLVAVDVDSAAEKNFEKITHRQTAVFFQDNFSQIDRLLGKKKADFILADLGWRLEQIRKDEYGLNFSSEISLSMRLDGKKNGLTAEQVVNSWPISQLAEIFRVYGEEKMAELAARAIGSARKEKAILTAKQLAEVVSLALGRFYRNSRLHPATRVFQALRIFVNKELDNLEIFLEKALVCLQTGGRLAVITFHSGEDRIVKKFFRANARGCICPPDFPKCICGRKPALKILTKKPLLPSDKELIDNPRSRSAKLRVAEKI